MKRQMLKWIFAAMLGMSVVAGTGAAAKADEYWNNYWGWYDGTYRPYYLARPGYSSYYYGQPAYGGYYTGRPHYGNYYYGSPYSGSYYRSYYAPTYGRYYGVPRAGYYESPYGGGEVNVGRLRIGWR